METDSQWISTNIELPPHDGEFEVCNDEKVDGCLGFYDGYGFQLEGIYRSPLFWRNTVKQSKRYGKLNQPNG